MSHKQVKKRRDYYKNMMEYYQEQRDLYKDVYDKYKGLSKSAIDELQFERLQVEHLKSVLYEIESFTEDKLVVGVIKNAIERHNLDKLIHTRKLFD